RLVLYIPPSLLVYRIPFLCVLLLILFLFFFFSSRRRHTRSKRDWSSDVCSSDLAAPCARHRSPDPGGRRRLRSSLRDERKAPSRSAGRFCCLVIVNLPLPFFSRACFGPFLGRQLPPRGPREQH